MHPRLVAVAQGQAGLFTHAQAMACGYAHDEVLREVGRRRWLRVRYGVMAERHTVEAAKHEGAEAWHLLQVGAVLLRVGPDLIASHESAATAWTVPLLGFPPADVVITGAKARPRRARGYVVHRARLDEVDRSYAAGLPVTSLPRTIVDIARCSGTLAGLVAADAALHRALCTPAELEAALCTVAQWPGYPSARVTVDMADGGAESPGETRARFVMVSDGIPAPVLGFRVRGRSGKTYHTDFGWEAFRTVGEYDGRVKYYAPDRPQLGDPLWREKVREDDIRAAGWEFVRMTNEMVTRKGVLAERLRAAFQRGLQQAN